MNIFGFFRKEQGSEHIIVVSGLPRSGTSMMMQILQAGGISILTDQVRQPDEDNSRGYYEHDSVKSLSKGNVDFLNYAEGKAVKVVSNLLKHLPKDRRYKIICMRRDVNEILASQKIMLGNLNSRSDQNNDVALAKKYDKHLQSVVRWAPNQAHFEFFPVDYSDVIRHPEKQVDALIDFLDVRLNKKRMVQAVDAKMWHHK